MTEASSLTRYLREQIPNAIDKAVVRHIDDIFDIFLHTKGRIETKRLILEICAFYTQKKGLVLVVKKESKMMAIIDLNEHNRRIATIVITNTTNTTLKIAGIEIRHAL